MEKSTGLLAQLLEARFGPLPPVVSLKLDTITETERLARLVLWVYTVAPLEDFSTLLEKRQ